jgi:glycine cleavage system H protein
MAKFNVPGDLKYTKSDEWIKLENGEATVGVSDYAQDALSDIVYVELPQIGDSFKKGESFGTVESVKAASDLNMPIGGTVTAVNKALEDSPENVNKDPYGTGWFVKIKATDPKEADGLLDSSAYEKYLNER